MGVYATPAEPKDGAFVTANTSFVAFHSYSSDGSDNTAGDDYEGAHQERYRLIGAGTWTELAVQLGQMYTVYTGGLAAGNYERQVRAQSNNTGVWGAYSASAFFTSTAAPAAPTFTSPAAGSTVTTGTVAVNWTATTFTAYELEVRSATGGGGVQQWTSGVVTTGTTGTTATLPSSGGARYLRLRIRNNGVWSAWTERQIIVSYASPMQPSIVATRVDVDGLGFQHALDITVTHPTPSGGAPAVNSMDIYAYAIDDPNAKEYLVLPAQTPTGTKTWRTPAAQRYQLRVVAKAADGRTTSSNALIVAALAFKGFTLHDPDDPESTVKAYRYNDEGASDSWEIENALIEYQGREYPVAEFGDGTRRSVSVDLIHSKGFVDARSLLYFLRMRRVLCYRDSKGRKLYGMLKLGDTRDTFYGFTTGVTIEAVDYPPDREVY